MKSNIVKLIIALVVIIAVIIISCFVVWIVHC